MITDSRLVQKMYLQIWELHGWVWDYGLYGYGFGSSGMRRLWWVELASKIAEQIRKNKPLQNSECVHNSECVNIILALHHNFQLTLIFIHNSLYANIVIFVDHIINVHCTVFVWYEHLDKILAIVNTQQ